jgi:mono/diheme cytochrome c family protein
MRSGQPISIGLGAVVATVALCFIGCNSHSGRPGAEPEVARPEQVVDFSTLYKTNCSGCHGANGTGGAAMSLANPVYLAVAGEDVIRNVAANGVHGELMPAFARSRGGILTDQQIDVLVHGMTQQWTNPQAVQMLKQQGLPPYKASAAGNVTEGQRDFQTFCASCHGATGQGNSQPHDGKGKTGSIVDAAYLNLVSDQSLRSVIIAGRKDQAMPDWRGDAATPMTDQQITDIVAWLASQRTENPGQPYPVRP